MAVSIRTSLPSKMLCVVVVLAVAASASAAGDKEAQDELAQAWLFQAAASQQHGDPNSQYRDAVEAYNSLVHKQYKMPKYWIGVHCQPAKDVVLSHAIDTEDGDESIELSLKGGLVVVSAIEGGPAKKAGIKPEDIIVRIEGSETSSMEDLIAAIGESDGEPIKVMVLRDRQARTIEVTPQKRNDRNIAAAAGHLNRVVHNWQAMSGSLPEGVTLTMKKKGGEPATFVLEKEDEEAIEFSAKNLAAAPKNLKTYVRRLAAVVDQPPMHHYAWVPQQPSWSKVNQQPVLVRMAGQPTLEQKLDELTQRVEALNDKLEKLAD